MHSTTKSHPVSIHWMKSDEIIHNDYLRQEFKNKNNKLTNFLNYLVLIMFIEPVGCIKKETRSSSELFNINRAIQIHSCSRTLTDCLPKIFFQVPVSSDKHDIEERPIICKFRKHHPKVLNAICPIANCF